MRNDEMPSEQDAPFYDVEEVFYGERARFQHDEGEQTRALGPLASTPVIDDIGGVPTIQSSTLFLTHLAALNADVLVDNAGNSFHAIRMQDGNWTRAYIQKIDRNGALVNQWQVIAAGGYKIDGLGIAASGADLIVTTVAHDTPNPVPPDGRYSSYGIAKIPGVFVPFGNQLPKAGAAGAFLPEMEAGAEVDYNRIGQIVELKVAAAIDDLASRFGGNSIRQGIEQKVGDGLLYMSDPANYGKEWKTRQFQDVTFKRDMDRLYVGLNKHIIGENPGLPVENEGFKKLIKQLLKEVLVENGLIKPPPTP